MRDSNRIDIILSQIQDILTNNAGITLGKLVNLIGGDPAAYYIEDDQFVTEAANKLSYEIKECKLTDKNLIKLGRLWKQYPRYDLRLGQIICNMVTDREILDKVSDDALVDALLEYYGGVNERN